MLVSTSIFFPLANSTEYLVSTVDGKIPLKELSSADVRLQLTRFHVLASPSEVLWRKEYGDERVSSNPTWLRHPPRHHTITTPHKPKHDISPPPMKKSYPLESERRNVAGRDLDRALAGRQYQKDQQDDVYWNLIMHDFNSRTKATPHNLEELFGPDPRERPAGKQRASKKQKSVDTSSAGGSTEGSQSEFVSSLVSQDYRRKSDAAERAYEVKRDKELAMMQCRELELLMLDSSTLSPEKRTIIEKKQAEIMKKYPSAYFSFIFLWFCDCILSFNNRSIKPQDLSFSSSAAMATKVQRIMTQPINLIFRFLQSKARIQIWLFEQKDLRIEGRIIGFDEYMNLVLDEAEEVSIKKKTRKPLGRILLKGDNITLMMNSGKGVVSGQKRFRGAQCKWDKCLPSMT
nr:small nuclear ribonucleoprotein E-like [Tanacetum cinerariifolium]